MKKAKTIIAAIVTVCAIFACEKKEILDSQDPVKALDPISSSSISGLTAVNGAVSFPDYTSYETLVNDTSQSTYSDWRDQSGNLSFSALQDNRSSDSTLYESISSDLFRSVLNVQGRFIIGSYMIKIHPSDSTAYILYDPSKTFGSTDVANLNAFDTTQNNIIGMECHRNGIELLKEFDDALAANSTLSFRGWWAAFIISNPNIILKTTFCTQSGCGERDKIVNFGAFNSFAIQAQYQRFAFFFTLHGFFIPSGTLGQVKFDVPICCYKKKCSSNGGGSQSCAVGVFAIKNRITCAKYQSYQGSTPLNGFRFKLRGTNVSCGVQWSPFAEISANSPC